MDSNTLEHGYTADETIILLLTKTFPFDIGEEFIENELPILAATFDKVVIVATSVKRGGMITREIPNNVEVFHFVDSTNRYIRYFKYVLTGLLYRNSGIVRTELQYAHGVLQKTGVYYLLGRAQKNMKAWMRKDELKDLFFQNKKIILYSYWFNDLALLIIMLKNKFFNHGTIKTISRAHGYDLYEDRNITGYIPFRRYVFENIDKVYPCAQAGTDYLIQKFPEYAAKVQTSYLGTLDYGMNRSVKNNGLFHIVTCSGIVSVKRVLLCAKAIAELEKKGIILKWTCIGDGPLVEELRQYVKENISKSVVDFKGWLNKFEIMAFYQKEYVDLFINVSQSEGLPVSVMEAISFGIPILATDVGGTGEIVKNGITGLLIPKDLSEVKLAEYIREMELMELNRENIRKFWSENFSASHNYRSFIQEITKM